MGCKGIAAELNKVSDSEADARLVRYRLSWMMMLFQRPCRFSPVSMFPALAGSWPSPLPHWNARRRFPFRL